MKLLSFAADGKEWFGAARDDGVITLNDKVGQPNLRAALAAGAMEAMRSAAKDATPDRKLPRWDATCQSNRACSFAWPIPWSAMAANSFGPRSRIISISKASLRW